MDLKEVNEERISPKRYDQPHLNLIEVFEFFIGNTDWSVARGPADEDCCHNTIPFEHEDGHLIPVPYDFDSTGVVNPPHASVGGRLPIKNVRQRLYRGFCQDDELLHATLARFQEIRPGITALYQSQEGLSSRSIKRTEKYYNDFYEIISDDKKIKRSLLDKCRQIY